MMTWQDTDPAWVAVAGIAGFLVLWLAISVAIGKLGGWRRLATRYRQSMPVRGKVLRGQSAAMRYGTSYRNALNFTVSHRGLGVSVVFPFRAGHAPLLFPWGDITVSREQAWFGPAVRLSFSRVPDVCITLAERTVQRLRETAGDLWPER